MGTNFSKFGSGSCYIGNSLVQAPKNVTKTFKLTTFVLIRVGQWAWLKFHQMHMIPAGSNGKCSVVTLEVIEELTQRLVAELYCMGEACLC